MEPTAARPPLEGIRVLEVGVFMAAPFAAMQLADLGAEVIKVEDPRSGDPVRASGPFVEGESSPYLRLNRNKESVALDLKSDAGKAAFLALVETADVVVENLRPGAMARLSLDAAGAESCPGNDRRRPARRSNPWNRPPPGPRWRASACSRWASSWRRRSPRCSWPTSAPR